MTDEKTYPITIELTAEEISWIEDNWWNPTPSRIEEYDESVQYKVYYAIGKYLK